MPSPPAAHSEDTSVPAPFFQPPGVIVESPQVSQALGGMVGSIVGHPTFLQAPWTFNHVTADYCLKHPVTSHHGVPVYSGMRSSSQDLLPTMSSDCVDAHKGFPSQTSRAVGDNSLTFHNALSSDGTSNGPRLVGSPAITRASTARRSGGSQARLYFCEISGCTSQGFTSKYNLQCSPGRSYSRAHRRETIRMRSMWTGLLFELGPPATPTPK
ncbi:hypothetical protein PQX77_002524 [Marasmius sp. AFHP31]|nr:hypothetical protein PQX77_002524 [Marasmius sp. AFHP31]